MPELSMTKSKKESSQQTIFEYLKKVALQPQSDNNKLSGSLDINKELKAAMSEDIRHAIDERGKELSRYEVAGRMSELLEEDITKTTLDNWTASSHPHEIPARYIPAFVIATGQRRVFEVLSRHAGLFALPGPEALRAEIQRLDEEIKRKKEEKKKRQIFLKELDSRFRGNDNRGGSDQ